MTNIVAKFIFLFCDANAQLVSRPTHFWGF